MDANNLLAALPGALTDGAAGVLDPAVQVLPSLVVAASEKTPSSLPALALLRDARVSPLFLPET